MGSMKLACLLLIVLFSMVLGNPIVSDDDLKAREEALVERRKAVEALRIERMKFAEEIAKEVEELLKEVEETEKEGGKFKTPFQLGKKCKDLNPAELFVQAATDGVGKCKLQISDDDDHAFCWIYLKAAEKDVHGDRGFPKQTLPGKCHTISHSLLLFLSNMYIYRRFISRFGLRIRTGWSKATRGMYLSTSPCVQARS